MYPFPANYFKADGVTGGNPDSVKMQMVFPFQKILRLFLSFYKM